MRSSSAFLIGVGIGYLFDPRLGKQRRTQLRDRALKAGRRLKRTVVKKARFAGGGAQGLAARSRRLVMHPEVATDDATVEQRVRSEAFRDLGASIGDVEVEVENGTARVSGSVSNDDVASDLVARVAKIEGVENVTAMLHVASDRA